MPTSPNLQLVLCPRCNARTLQRFGAFECLTHGEVLAPEKQRELDAWRARNAEVKGDTRRMRGGDAGHSAPMPAEVGTLAPGVQWLGIDPVRAMALTPQDIPVTNTVPLRQLDKRISWRWNATGLSGRDGGTTSSASNRTRPG